MVEVSNLKSANTMKKAPPFQLPLGKSFPSSLHYNLHVRDQFSYIEDESRDRSVSLYVDHGQCVWKVTLTRAHEEQPGHSIHELRRIT